MENSRNGCCGGRDSPTSPLVLLLLDALFPVDWRHLSDIGQSYTGISTLLAAGALVAVAISARLQARQLSITQVQSTRDQQFRIIQLALDDPELAAAIPFKSSASSATQKQMRYISMQFLFWEYALLFGHVTPSGLEDTLRTQYFTLPMVCQFWEDRRLSWITQVSSPGMHAFVHIVETAYNGAKSDTEQKKGQP